MFNALVAEQLPGPGSVFLRQEWDYPAPVFVGDTVTAEVEVLEARPDKPITRLRCVARRQDGTEVLRGESVVYTARPR
jgi:acyl dehydratase